MTADDHDAVSGMADAIRHERNLSAIPYPAEALARSALDYLRSLPVSERLAAVDVPAGRCASCGDTTAAVEDGRSWWCVGGEVYVHGTEADAQAEAERHGGTWYSPVTDPDEIDRCDIAARHLTRSATSPDAQGAKGG